MANQDHQHVTIVPGDTVVLSASAVPGNESLVYRTVDNLFKLGARVLYNRIANVHVRGHAAQEELKIIHALVKPRYFVPVHGEYRHLLGHARLAETAGLPSERVFLLEDGMGLEVTKTAARVVGRYPVGRVLVDGKGVGDIGAVVLRDRQLLAQDGLVTVGLVVGRDGAVKAGPEIVSRGFVYVKENEPLLDELRDAVRAALDGREPAALDREAIAALVRVTVRSFINQRFQRKPVVLPVILEV
jgi:ribonuclease J